MNQDIFHNKHFSSKMLVVFVLLFGLVRCSSSSITHSWRSENTEKKHFNNIMVVGIAKIADHDLREKMETHLANDLNEHGIKTASSFKTYGPNSFENVNDKSMLNQLQQDHIDALLTIVLLNKEKEKYYTPARVHYTPYAIYYGNFWGYYTTIYERTYEEDYYTENTSYFWESNLYDVATKKLIYSVQTKSFESSSTEKLAHEYGKLICADILKQNILQ